MKCFFDVKVLYYLPHFLPIYRELRSRGTEVLFVFHNDPLMESLLQRAIAEEELPARMVASEEEAARLYRSESPDWVIFGNTFAFLQQLPDTVRTAQVFHGPGVKECYYGKGLMEMDVRFVEGEFRARELLRRYPGARVKEVGYARLDPLFGPSGERPRIDLSACSLDPGKKTVLYAPTYYPSSIEMLPDDLPSRLEGLNLIVKPHFFTYSSPTYKAQREKLRRWERSSSVFLAPPESYDILPYFSVSDVLVSEASSTLFEFAAMDRPVVWLDFLKLRWSYRGPLRFRFTRRMDTTILRYADIARHAAHAADFEGAVRQEIEGPACFREKRMEYTRELFGETDGRVSCRIADYLFS